METQYFPNRFQGKAALLVGVGRGSTKSAAVRMAAEGADVAVTDIVKDYVDEAANECKQHGHKALGLVANAGNMDEMKKAVDEVLAQFGKIDIMVYGAVDISGVGGPLTPFVKTEKEEWDKQTAVGYTGFLIACKLVLPNMIERNYGKIIGVATDAARVGTLGESLIGGSRAGMTGFSKSLAREVARNQINVNIVAPGPHDTPNVRSIEQQQGAEFFKKVVEAMVAWVPFKRMGTCDEIAAGTCFLASDDASFITGQTLSVSGGLTML